MARIFRQRYTTKDGDGRKVKRQNRKWYVEYKDSQGIRKRVPGYTDKEATQQLRSDLVKQAAREASGLTDRFAEYRKRPLTEHLIDYTRHLETVACSDHVRTTIGRIRRTLNTCKFTYWKDLSASKVQAYVAHLGRCHGLSVQTCNFYLQISRRFVVGWFATQGHRTTRFNTCKVGIPAPTGDTTGERSPTMSCGRCSTALGTHRSASV